MATRPGRNKGMERRELYIRAGRSISCRATLIMYHLVLDASVFTTSVVVRSSCHLQCIDNYAFLRRDGSIEASCMCIYML